MSGSNLFDPAWKRESNQKRELKIREREHQAAVQAHEKFLASHFGGHGELKPVLVYAPSTRELDAIAKQMNERRRHSSAA